MSRLFSLFGFARPSPASLSLLVCALGMGLDQAELQMGGALATIFSSPPYSLDSRSLSWMLGAVYIGGWICTPLLGKAADRRGLRLVLGWTVLWLGITSLLSCVRDDPTWLGVCRLLIGVSLGAYPPLMVAYITSIAPENRRARWIFWVCGLAYVATPISLFTLRFLTDLHPAGLAGWRWLSAAIGLLALATAHLFKALPESAQPQPEAACLTRPGITDLFVKAPLRRTFVFVAALYFLYPWGAAGFIVLTGPVLLQRGFSVSNALWYVSFAALWPVVGTLAAAWVVDRIPRRLAMVSCCMIMLTAALIFFTGNTRVSLSIALVAFGVGQALYPGVLTTFGAENFPVIIRATANSMAWSLNRVASFLVPISLLPLLSNFGSMTAGVCVGGALLLSALVTLGFGPVNVSNNAHRGLPAWDG